MGIRKTKKDYLKEHASLELVPQQPLRVPESDDPLVFWTRYSADPIKVDLNEFAVGKSKAVTGRKSEILFTGRPGLIAQIAPGLEEALVAAAPGTVSTYINALRLWWSVLDRVESSAENAGATMPRVDDVRMLTEIHAERARNTGMGRKPFSNFRALVDSKRVALGARETYWRSPEGTDTEAQIPPEEHRKAVRLAIKYACRRVVDRWAFCAELEQRDTEPAESKDAELWRAVRHMRATQNRTGKIVPSGDDLDGVDHDGFRDWCRRHVATVPEVRATVFPDKRQALAVFTQCMATTGWNPAVMLGLDVTSEFLIDHPKDNEADPHRRWVLIGHKERAGGTEQYTFGQWKSLDLAGHLIKTYLARVVTLRASLRAECVSVQAQYELEHKKDAGSEETQDLFKRLTWLRQASRRVWLYVDRSGKIDALDENYRVTRLRRPDGDLDVTYLDELLEELNKQRQAEGKQQISSVTYSDFRLWFADYLYRASFGNLLVVQLGLNHKEIRTTQGYVNTNLANKDAANQARKFLEILTDQLDQGRIDLTILAHLVRHGPLTPEQEKKLAELRQFSKSRQRVGCRDPRNPPQHLKATPGQACDAQRCLLCADHAVLLPESLPGIAMREAELLAMQLYLPTGTFTEGLYDLELQNQQAALLQFDPAKVSKARSEWAEAVRSGRHPVPGMPGVIRIFEEQT